MQAEREYLHDLSDKHLQQYKVLLERDILFDLKRGEQLTRTETASLEFLDKQATHLLDEEGNSTVPRIVTYPRSGWRKH